MAQSPARWAYPLSLLFKLANVDLVNDLVIGADQSLMQVGELVTEIIKGKEYRVPLPSEPTGRQDEASE